MSCTLASIKAATDRCKFVQAACEDFNTLNYFVLRYCQIPESTPLFLTVVGLSVFASFYLLSNISDKYLSPSLSMVSKKLKLSEAMAGVTILAFANGSPDIIASFSAGGDETGGVFISIGSLFGGCLFASTIVLGVCILNSKTGIYVLLSDSDGSRRLAPSNLLLHSSCSGSSYLRVHRPREYPDGAEFFRTLLDVGPRLT